MLYDSLPLSVSLALSLSLSLLPPFPSPFSQQGLGFRVSGLEFRV